MFLNMRSRHGHTVLTLSTLTNAMEQTIFSFHPYLKSTLWGGDDIARFKDLAAAPHDIGESWEISAMPGCESVVAEGPDTGLPLSKLVEKYGRSLLGIHVARKFGSVFPLLVKFIGSSSDLSLQVHPDDTLAMKRHGSVGKTEMWHILRTRPGARIHIGLSHPLSPSDYDRHVKEGTMMDAVAHYESHPGDTFFIPPGTLHSIGAGNFLAEIQQACDITYRVDDFGRRDANGSLRELHTDLAREAIDFNNIGSHAPVKDSSDSLRHIISLCRHFKVEKLRIPDKLIFHNDNDSFIALICIDGNGAVANGDEVSTISRGHSLLIAAQATTISLSGPMTLLAITIPDSDY